MRIVFIKDFVDIESYSTPVIVKFGDEGTLIDEDTCTVELDSGGTISFVNQGSFLPACEDELIDELINCKSTI